MDLPAPFERLTTCLAKLPGIGRKSAERMALRIVLDPGDLRGALIESLEAVGRALCPCRLCGAITTTEHDPCRLCTDPRRDGHVLCVVEEPADITSIERSGGFHGRYHALMGKISPMRGNGPEHLRVKALVARLDQEPVNEVVLALSTDVEGDATASFLAEVLKGRKVTVTRLASGLPASSAVLYSDPVTLARAMQGRQTA